MVLNFLTSIVVLSTLLFWLVWSYTTIDPSRALVSFFIPVSVASLGVRKKSLDWTGALSGFLVGYVLTASNYCFLAILLVFFVSSSKATKFRGNQKQGFEADFKEGGQRNWVQVVCNGGVATVWALCYLLTRGPGERFIAFRSDFWGSWLNIAVLSAMACSAGDTWASELGSVLSSKDPRLLTTLRPVPRGTNGGVSSPGLVFSFLGGLVLGLAYYLTLALLRPAWHQWPLIAVAGVAGLLGSLIDSFLGATLQFSGLDTKSGKIVEVPGPGVTQICGRSVLDNHSVNFMSSALTSFLVPALTAKLWP